MFDCRDRIAGSIAGAMIAVMLLVVAGPVSGEKTVPADTNDWFVVPDYDTYKPEVIAVLPMDNFSLEPEHEKALFDAVYDRLMAKGYRKIDVHRVERVMNDLGIQVAGQLSGISAKRLGKALNCDAVIKGQIDQAAGIHKGVYDAVVVSCSLTLQNCHTGRTLWQTQQWRAAHRQWQVDPVNLFLNLAAHSMGSRKQRIAWLVEEMLKTLPAGTVQTVSDNLLDQALEIEANEE